MNAIDRKSSRANIEYLGVLVDFNRRSEVPPPRPWYAKSATFVVLPVPVPPWPKGPNLQQVPRIPRAALNAHITRP